MLAQTNCNLASNPIVCENMKPGDPASLWDVSGSGSSSIQGFTTDISAAPGQTVQFKIDTPSSNYRLDIYRMGYYSGMGARKVATVTPSAIVAAESAELPDQRGIGTGRLRELGGLRVLARSRRRRVGHPLRQARGYRQRRLEPRRLHRPRSDHGRTSRPSCSRRRTRPGRPTTTTAATACTKAAPARTRRARTR